MFFGQKVSAQAEQTRRPQFLQWCRRFIKNPKVESHTAHLYIFRSQRGDIDTFVRFIVEAGDTEA